MTSKYHFGLIIFSYTYLLTHMYIRIRVNGFHLIYLLWICIDVFIEDYLRLAVSVTEILLHERLIKW